MELIHSVFLTATLADKLTQKQQPTRLIHINEMKNVQTQVKFSVPFKTQSLSGCDLSPWIHMAGQLQNTIAFRTGDTHD